MSCFISLWPNGLIWFLLWCYSPLLTMIQPQLSSGSSCSSSFSPSKPSNWLLPGCGTLPHRLTRAWLTRLLIFKSQLKFCLLGENLPSPSSQGNTSPLSSFPTLHPSFTLCISFTECTTVWDCLGYWFIYFFTVCVPSLECKPHGSGNLV